MGDEQFAEALKGARQALCDSRFEDGLVLAEAILADRPDNIDALLVAAALCRHAERFPQAANYIERLHAVVPESGRAWEETGHLARAQGRAEEALSAYGRAVRYDPALEESWRAQMELYAATGRPAEALAARERRHLR